MSYHTAQGRPDRPLTQTHIPTAPARLRRAAVLVAIAIASLQAGCANRLAEPRTRAAFNAEMAYLEKIVNFGEEIHPQIFLLLMQEYQNNDSKARGVAFLTDFLERRGSGLPPARRALCLSALGVLRAESAADIPLLSRSAWVEDTIALLDAAHAIEGENSDIFFSRFATGVVYSQLPERFGKHAQAREDLEWLINHAELAPNPGIMRLVYRQYATLQGNDSNQFAESLTSPFSVSSASGATLNEQRFQELVPGRVFLVSGLEFTEYYFILTEDRQQLISIDAGTRADFAAAAYRVLSQHVANLPPLTTVFVTHSHWDHVGGQKFFRKLNPEVRFFGSENFYKEKSIIRAGPQSEVAWFFGDSFDFEALYSYKPDVPIHAESRIEIGGTRFRLIPAPASETSDALFVFMPDERVLFVGDVMMPFVGAPFVEEGHVDSLLAAMDLVDTTAPSQVFHGHQPLTNFFQNPDFIRRLRPHVQWLIEQTKKRIRAGLPRGEIHRANLYPESILKDAQSQQFFLVMREQVINRLYDQSVGYWEADLSGLDTLDAKSYGVLLSHYLAMDEKRAAQLISEMLEGGDYHMAERVVRWARAQWPSSQRLSALQRQAARKLRSKYQQYNPFKFILYSELAGAPVPRTPAARKATAE